MAVLRQRRDELVVEGLLGLLRLVPVAGTDVEPVQPDLADVSVGLLRRRLRVDDGGPLAHRDLTARHLGDRVRRTLVDDGELARVEIVTVDVDDLRLVVALGRGDEEGGLGHAVAGFDGGLRQAVGARRPR